MLLEWNKILMPLIWSGCPEFDPLMGQIQDTPRNNGISTIIACLGVVSEI